MPGLLSSEYLLINPFRLVSHVFQFLWSHC
jgi:hypothetical protein